MWESLLKVIWGNITFKGNTSKKDLFFSCCVSYVWMFNMEVMQLFCEWLEDLKRNNCQGYRIIEISLLTLKKKMPNTFTFSYGRHKVVLFLNLKESEFSQTWYLDMATLNLLKVVHRLVCLFMCLLFVFSAKVHPRTLCILGRCSITKLPPDLQRCNKGIPVKVGK